jgi:hypothetical protein
MEATWPTISTRDSTFHFRGVPARPYCLDCFCSALGPRTALCLSLQWHYELGRQDQPLVCILLLLAPGALPVLYDFPSLGHLRLLDDTANHPRSTTAFLQLTFLFTT